MPQGRIFNYTTSTSIFNEAVLEALSRAGINPDLSLVRIRKVRTWRWQGVLYRKFTLEIREVESNGKVI